MQDSKGQWRTGRDEPVEVNQRALIHKVLARYSGEFTVFRELLQNSDDAHSRVVEIRFETAAYLDRRKRKEENHSVPPTLPDLSSTPVMQWSFKNNGKVFSEQDWMRLPKIAEGNPDPEKIGAFGVGFYSLFSVTECPFVSSGGQRMEFYWKDDKDQLHVRHCHLQRETLNPWTTFGMPLRKASPIPPALEFMRFLASSITFMINLREVGVFFDEHCIGCIKKLPGNIQSVTVPRELKCSSKIMNVEEFQCHPITIEAEVMQAIYTAGQSPPQPGAATLPHQPMRLHRTKVDLTVFAAQVKVELNRELSAELFRCMKKQPPSRLKYSLIYTGKEEYDRSVADLNDPTGFYSSVFQGLRADLNGATDTRIFIGHATGQTTGVGGHMTSWFIPTVERESIDLVDRNVAVWNKELLSVGGFLSRAVYELELSKIQDAWEAGFDGTADLRPSPELRHTLHQWFLHVLKFFTFHRSTPSAQVARLLKAAFYGCTTGPVRFLSSAGVRLATEIKEYDPAFAKFLKYLPILPRYVLQECPGVVEALPDQHRMSPVTFSDILQDLRERVLTREELIACLRWWMNRKNASLQDTTELLGTITICGANGSPLCLSSVEYFIGPGSLEASIPLDGPLPASLIPHEITTTFTPTDLTSLGWQEFTVIDWLRHISQQKVVSAGSRHDFCRSTKWAERVFSILSGVWSSQSDEDELYHLAKTIFMGKKCIPTSHGLCAPEESFLSGTNTTLFQDLNLPTVRFSTGLETKEDMGILLSSIGVKENVPSELLLDRMVRTGNWSIPDLIRYLLSVREILTSDELSRLGSFAGFTEEGAWGDGGKRRYRIMDLYPPLDIFRELRLPVIDWDERWQNESDQAALLYRLGLHHYPPLEEIVRLSSVADVALRETAFQYLCDNLRSNYSRYNPDNFRDIAFIPAENKNDTYLAKLGDVFFSIRWKALGFAVIPDKYQKAPVSELGVQQHPPPSRFIQLLETKPPTNKEIAREWFEYLYGCLSSFSQMDLTKLTKLPIVPTESSTDCKWIAPTQCYLNQGTRDDFHKKMFVFVDFGSIANRFLRACGSKDEPSVKDIAESLVEDPKRFYDLAGGHGGFLAKLRDLAFRKYHIPNVTLDKMMTSPILLGIRRKKSNERGEDGDEHVLEKPREIVVADDTDTYQLFGDAILVAPQDVPELEEFYVALGCRQLSTIVEEKYNALNEIQDPSTSTSVRTLIFQRLPLFLRGYNHTQFQFPISLLRVENFKVKVCKKLVVSKTLTIGGNQMTRSQDVWAAIQHDVEEHVELWVSGDAEPNMYEIAATLCRLLFGTVKVNDTLLLATILSAPLETLNRRGYSADKISSRLQQPSEDPQLTEEATDTRRVTQAITTTSIMNCASEQSEITIDGASSVVACAQSSTDRLMPRAFVTLPGNTSSESIIPLHHSVDRAPNSTASQIQNLIHRFVPRRGFSETLQYSRTLRQVMPQSYIRANVNMAMNACKPEGGKLLHQRSRAEDIREFPNTGYCDVSGRVGKLEHRGEIGRVEVFTTEDVPDPDTFMDTKHDVLSRFVDVITHVAELYGLSLTVLRVFCDVAGGPIAFNRDGSIFLNLRYFEAWHDRDVQNGDPQRAQISWFFTLAHELAHNLVKEHNSEHEFWFAAICEAHVWEASKRTLT